VRRWGSSTVRITFLAGTGSIVLTFLAGAELARTFFGPSWLAEVLEKPEAIVRRVPNMQFHAEHITEQGDRRNAHEDNEGRSESLWEHGFISTPNTTTRPQFLSVEARLVRLQRDVLVGR
jgi:hypothetical protein